MLKKRLFITIFVAAILLTAAYPVLADNINDGGNYGLKKTAAKLGYYTDIQETLPVLILQWLRIFLGFTSIIFLGFTLYAGVRWITARGKEELVTKAKETLQSSITGLVIIALSFAIVNFVFETLKISNAGTPAGGRDAEPVPEETLPPDVG